MPYRAGDTYLIMTNHAFIYPRTGGVCIPHLCPDDISPMPHNRVAIEIVLTDSYE